MSMPHTCQCRICQREMTNFTALNTVNALAAELAEVKSNAARNNAIADEMADRCHKAEARVAAMEAAKGLLEDAVRQIVETSQEHPAKANYVAVHRQIIGYARTLIQPSPAETGAKHCTCDNEDPFKCKCKESSAACHCVCHGL